MIPQKSITDVFVEVEKGRADYGVVPIENSTEGVINHTLDMFMDYDLKISAEVLLEVSHNLLSKSGEKGKIKKIYYSDYPHLLGTLFWIDRQFIPEQVPQTKTRLLEII